MADDTFSIARTEDGVLDPVVGDSGDVDADVVAGDDPLGLDRQRDDPQRDPVNTVHQRDDEDHTRPARILLLDATQMEHDGALVLLDYEEANHAVLSFSPGPPTRSFFH